MLLALVSPFGGGDLSDEEAYSIESMSPAWLGVTGVLICAVGVVGDLWESLLKRLAMVKVRRKAERAAGFCGAWAGAGRDGRENSCAAMGV